MEHSSGGWDEARMTRMDRLLSTASARLGLLHLALVTLALGTGTLLATLLHFRAGPDHLTTLRGHGLVMTMLVLVPAIPGVLGNLALPEALGLRELAFPRLGRAAVALHALAFVTFVVAAQTGGVSVGFELHMAHSGALAGAGVSWALLTVALSAGAIGLLSIRILASVLSSPRRTALGSGLAASSALASVSSPLALATLAMAALDRALGLGVVEASAGGDPALHAVLVGVVMNLFLTSSILAALAVITHVIDLHATPMHARVTTATFLGLALTGTLGGAQQLVSLDVGASAALRMGTFDVLHHALLLSLVLRWLLALRRGADTTSTPLHFGLSAMAMLAIALPSGFALALPSVGAFLQSSAFATGRLHYLAVGGVLLALLAGITEQWPRLVGVALSRERTGLGLGLVLAGTQLAFLPMLLLGARGTPRPLPPELGVEWLVVSGVGLVLLVTGPVLVGASLLGTLRVEPEEPQT